jgi:hypothetical protein
MADETVDASAIFSIRDPRARDFPASALAKHANMSRRAK